MKQTAAFVLVLILAACGGTSDSPTAPESTPTTKPKPSGLKVGQAYEADGLTSTLIEVDYPFTGDEKHVAPENTAFVGLDIKTCNDIKAKPTTSASNSDWTLIGATGVEYTGTKDIVWPDWPMPKYPEGAPLEPGTCSYGWVLLQVPGNEQFSAVHFKAPGAKTTATWKGTFARG